MLLTPKEKALVKKCNFGEILFKLVEYGDRQVPKIIEKSSRLPPLFLAQTLEAFSQLGLTDYRQSSFASTLFQILKLNPNLIKNAEPEAISNHLCKCTPTVIKVSSFGKLSNILILLNHGFEIPPQHCKLYLFLAADWSWYNAQERSCFKLAGALVCTSMI